MTATRGRTELVIAGGHHLRAVDGVLTGLHEPQATHIALLSAFLGAEALVDAYHEALGAGYLWPEVGDLHLIA